MKAWSDVDLQWAYGDLLGSIQRKTRSVDRAYDVLHDALVRYALIHRAEPILQPHAYLRTIVRSVLTDQGRAQTRLGIGIGIEVGTSLSELPSNAPSPEHLSDLYRRLAALQRIIDCLPPRCREVFWLYRVKGHSQGEIAAELGITIKVVEKHVMRALIEIRAARYRLA
jgi:RNA polymerase sigma-70 factor (ECF subfamily)